MLVFSHFLSALFYDTTQFITSLSDKCMHQNHFGLQTDFLTQLMGLCLHLFWEMKYGNMPCLILRLDIILVYQYISKKSSFRINRYGVI